MEIVYSEDKINPEEVVRYLSLTRQIQPVSTEIIKQKEVLKKARELKIEVSDEQLQDFSDKFRTACGLNTAEETLDFFERAGLTEDDFEAFCETSLLTSMLKNHLADENRIEEYFANNRAELDVARISSIMVKDENLANEILLQVTEDEEDFHTLARLHSLDEATKYSGGYVGYVSRGMLLPEISTRIFNADAGDLLGPFALEECHQLILVEEIKKAELNEESEEIVKEGIFNEWISQFLEGGIKITV